MVSNDIERNHFDKACNEVLSKRLEIVVLIRLINHLRKKSTRPIIKPACRSTYSRRRRTKCTIGNRKTRKNEAEKAKQQDNNERLSISVKLVKPIPIVKY